MRTVVAAADTHAFWQVVLGMGLVVVLVVIVLMMLLLSLIKDIEERVGQLIQSALAVAAQTSKLPKLAATPGVLALIIDEALVQNEYMDVLAAHYAAPGELVA